MYRNTLLNILSVEYFLEYLASLEKKPFIGHKSVVVVSDDLTLYESFKRIIGINFVLFRKTHKAFNNSQS